MTEVEYESFLRRQGDPEIQIAETVMAKTVRPRARIRVETPTEAAEQRAVIQYRDIMCTRYPELGMLHHIPNGGKRTKAEAAMLKGEGVAAGVPDLSLPVPRPRPDGGTWHGLYIELKVADHSNSPTAEQKKWLDALRSYGYMAVVAYGAVQAIQIIESYLGITEG